MSVEIHPTAIVAKGAELADGVSVGPFCVVGEDARLGAGTRLMSHVVIEGRTELGAGNTVHPFAVLGGPPQHTAYAGEATQLVIGDNNVIRMHVEVVRARGVVFKFKGRALVDEKVAAECEFAAMVVET